MAGPDNTSAGRADASAGNTGFDRLIRVLPIRWRILSIAILNTVVVLVLTLVVWDGARVLNTTWNELTQVRQSDRLLVTVESETGHLQSLIHRYFTQPNPDLFGQIMLLREALSITLQLNASADPLLSGSVQELVDVTEKFIVGFGDLRDTRAAISRTYENEVLKSAREISGLYAILESTTATRESLIWPALSKSRESFSATVVSANAYYLSLASDAGVEAQKNISAIEQTMPVMLDLAENEFQRNALEALSARFTTLKQGLQHLTEHFATQARLLRDDIDGNQTAMVTVINRLTAQVRERERQTQERFDQALHDVYVRVALVSIGILLVIVIIGTGIARSIIGPLRDLMGAMHAIVSGHYDRRVRGTAAHDEIGEMARAVDIFRENAIAKQRAEDELRAAKEHAEIALSDLRDTQRNLIEAEKLAALGGLVAGVAHEVNNPVGISLTVASSLARRGEAFAAEVESGQLRRSRLTEFVDGIKDAAHQLVANLQRAGELIQSFKQVAVDRSHAERRPFDIRQSTEQIVSSLRPGLKSSRLNLAVDVAEGIVLDSYPGPYGQVLTNLFLNAVTHGFRDGRHGTIRIDARKIDGQRVEIIFADDGVGMNDEVKRRAFDPFFTTRRGQGGTGLGLHIVYNLVTQRLGGRIALASAPNQGTVFTMTLPLVAPREEPAHIAEPETVMER